MTAPTPTARQPRIVDRIGVSPATDLRIVKFVRHIAMQLEHVGIVDQYTFQAEPEQELGERQLPYYARRVWSKQLGAGVVGQISQMIQRRKADVPTMFRGAQRNDQTGSVIELGDHIEPFCDSNRPDRPSAIFLKSMFAHSLRNMWIALLKIGHENEALYRIDSTVPCLSILD